MSCSGIYNIDLKQGSSFSVSVSISDSDNNPINISGYTGVAPIVHTWGDSGILDYFNTSITTPESGLLTMSLEHFETASLPVMQGRYELELYDTGNPSNVIKYLRGYVNVCPQISY